MADLHGTQIQIATEAPSQQVVHTVRLEFGRRSVGAIQLPTIRLWLDGAKAYSVADLGPAEAREVGRYLLALAESVALARLP